MTPILYTPDDLTAAAVDYRILMWRMREVMRVITQGYPWALIAHENYFSPQEVEALRRHLDPMPWGETQSRRSSLLRALAMMPALAAERAMVVTVMAENQHGTTVSPLTMEAILDVCMDHHSTEAWL